MLAKVEWFQRYMDASLHIMPPGISDHALLCLELQPQDVPRRKQMFKFVNQVVHCDGFLTEVANSWNQPLVGQPITYVCVMEEVAACPACH